KEAARDAPHQIAILSQEFSLTFSALDKYVDSLEPEFLLKEPTSVFFIAQLFAAWRRGLSVFPVNPRNPQTPVVLNRPHQSLLLYTSGSTGSPKIAVLSLQNLLANAREVVDLRPGDLWRLTLPLFHVGGIGIVLRCILARATI